MEKDKYYTPKLEELCTGLQLNLLDVEHYVWGSYVITTLDKPTDFLDSIESDMARVKKLDEEDIKCFGFTKRLKDEWIGWSDYYLGEISGRIGYFLSATLHKPRMDDVYKIYLHRYLAEDTKIESKLKEGDSELIYKGNIKNKFELKKLLEMLGINH